LGCVYWCTFPFILLFIAVVMGLSVLTEHRSPARSSIQLVWASLTHFPTAKRWPPDNSFYVNTWEESKENELVVSWWYLRSTRYQKIVLLRKWALWPLTGCDI
jgi:hypothetical protein